MAVNVPGLERRWNYIHVLLGAARSREGVELYSCIVGWSQVYRRGGTIFMYCWVEPGLERGWNYIHVLLGAARSREGVELYSCIVGWSQV